MAENESKSHKRKIGRQTQKLADAIMRRHYLAPYLLRGSNSAPNRRASPMGGQANAPVEENNRGFCGEIADHATRWKHKAGQGISDFGNKYIAAPAAKFGQDVSRRVHHIDDWYHGRLENVSPTILVQDGQVTVFASKRTRHLPPDKQMQSEQFAAAAIQSEGAVLYINGVNTSFAEHKEAALALARQTGKPVVGIYNETGGFGVDLVQSISDKMFDIGQLSKKGNPATAKLRVYLQKYAKHGLKIYAHSQGSIITSEALRQSKESGTSIQRHEITTMGNAAWTYPIGAQYHHHVHDDDMMPTFLGSGNVLFSRIGRRYQESAAANSKTTVLHHGGSGVEPHNVLGYIARMDEFETAGKRTGIDPVQQSLWRQTKSTATTVYALSKGLLSGTAEKIGEGYDASAKHIGRAAKFLDPNLGTNLVRPMVSGSEKIVTPLYNTLDRGMRLKNALIGDPVSRWTWNAADKGLRAMGRGAAAAGNLAAKGANYLFNPSTYWQIADADTRSKGRRMLVAGRLADDQIQKLYSNHAPAQIQRQSFGGQPTSLDADTLQADLLRRGGTGEPLKTTVRERLRGTLGFDPTMARVHRGGVATQAAQHLQAEAFTIGRDVFFGHGRYEEDTPAGIGLLAHELTHVGQQTGIMSDSVQFFSAEGGDRMEQEAQAVGERAYANAGRRGGLFVEDYRRVYESESGGLSGAEQQRLDTISLIALRQAESLLLARGQNTAILDSLNVEITLDLEQMTDQRAAQVWANALVAQIPDAAQTRTAAIVPRLQRRVSVELQDAPTEPVITKMKLDSDEKRVLAWLQKYQSLIIAAEKRFNVDRRAIAGAIAWEALENVHYVFTGKRFVGPGKVHTRKNIGSSLWSYQNTDADAGDTVAKFVEDRGEITETLNGKEVPVHRTLEERENYLKTPEGSIEYIGAILNAFAKIAEKHHQNIRRRPDILTNQFQGADRKEAKGNENNFEVWDQSLTKREQEAPGQPVPLIAKNRMPVWINKHIPYLEEAVGHPEPDPTVPVLAPVEAVPPPVTPIPQEKGKLFVPNPKATLLQDNVLQEELQEYGKKLDANIAAELSQWEQKHQALKKKKPTEFERLRGSKEKALKKARGKAVLMERERLVTQYESEHGIEDWESDKLKKTTALKVNEGQVTFDQEGTDSTGTVGFSRQPHWPGGKSGVTIGRGYDLGQHSAADVKKTLEAAGIPAAKVAILVAAATLKSDAAQKHWQEHPELRDIRITLEQQKRLFEAVYPEYLKAAKKTYDAKKPAVKFDDLPTGVQELLADLTYQYGNAAKAPAFKEIVAGDYAAAREKLLGAKKYVSRNKTRAGLLPETETKSVVTIP